MTLMFFRSLLTTAKTKKERNWEELTRCELISANVITRKILGCYNVTCMHLEHIMFITSSEVCHLLCLIWVRGVVLHSICGVKVPVKS